MSYSLPPIRSWLYAPGNNPKLLEKCFTAGADAVILDLEDAVPPGEKAHARDLVAAAIRRRWEEVGDSPRRPFVFVRINHPETGLAEDDVRAVVQPGLDGLRLPKVEGVDTVQLVSDYVSHAEQAVKLPVGKLPFVCNIETALGVFRAVDIASAHPRVLALGFGGADFARDINANATPDGIETLYARSHLVISSRVRGIRPPIDTVYRHIQDDAGLEAATRQGRALGFFGRSCIHPRQVPIVNAVFTPTAEELEWARSVVDASANAEAAGSGALKLPSGEFVDVAVLRRAEDLLKLAAAVGAEG